MKVNRQALIYSSSLAIILSQEAGTLRVFGSPNCDTMIAGSSVGPTVSQFWANKSTYYWRTDDSCSSITDDRGCYSVSVGKPATTEIWGAASGGDSTSTWGSYQIKTQSAPHEC